jgi:DNA polymerase-1
VPDSEKPTLLLIDGHSLAFRAFYALPIDSFTTRDGQHTNAIHGFISMLLLLLQQQRPTHLAVAFDVSRESFRTREYAEYKGTRGETPPEFKGQIPLLQEALTAMRVQVLTKPDYEADDILATLATRGAAEGYRVLVASGDRDTLQLVTDDITVLYPNVRGVSELKNYDIDAVRERYGIEPAQYPEVAALVGETSDNLIGIDKVGEKTAVKWVQEYGTVENLLAHADEITGVVGQNLRDQRDRAIRNRKLNALVTDVELEYGPADLARQPIDAPAVRELFDRLQFKTLLDRVFKIEGAAEDQALLEAPTATTTTAPTVATLSGEPLGDWLRAHEGRPIGVRITSLNGRPDAVGLSTADESVEVASASDSVLQSWLSSDAAKVLHDSKRATRLLADAGVELAGVTFDTMLGTWLLRPNQKVDSLGALIYYYLGETLPEPDPNQLVPATDAVSPATEAGYVVRLADDLQKRLDPGSLRVSSEIEVPLVAVLTRMERQGVTVSGPVLSELNARLGAEAADIAAQAYAEIGREVNLGSPKQLQEVLFDQLGMPKTRANKTGYSTDAASLADLQAQNPHPFLDLLLQHRDATKLRQIIETLDKAIGPDHRVHTRYDQTGTSTGRISSIDPNLQNIPVRSEEGRRIRSAFECGPEFETLLTVDYSQIEMRIMAHLSGDEGLIEAFRSGEDLHRFVGARIFGVTPAEVTPAMRSKVKAMSYGLAYGLSAFGLSRQLRIDTAEAKQLMADYFLRFGAVRDYLRGVVAQAREDGYTETIFGRRRPFGDLRSPNRVVRENAERQALNAPIQGSAADIMKIAMLGVASDMKARGLSSRMLLQVHDELIFEVAAGELDELGSIVRDRMSHAAALDVPLEVQLGTGPNWDAAAH